MWSLWGKTFDLFDVQLHWYLVDNKSYKISVWTIQNRFWFRNSMEKTAYKVKSVLKNTCRKFYKESKKKNLIKIGLLSLTVCLIKEDALRYTYFTHHLRWGTCAFSLSQYNRGEVNNSWFTMSISRSSLI